MQKIFEQYGGVITTAMAIVALVSLIGIFFTADGDGWMDNAFHDVVDGFVNKVEDVEPGFGKRAIVNVRDSYELENGYVNYAGAICEHDNSRYIRIPVEEGDTWGIWFEDRKWFQPGQGMLRLEDSSAGLVEAVDMSQLPQYHINPDSSISGAVVEIPAGVSYICFTLKLSNTYDFTSSAFVAKLDNFNFTLLAFGDSLTEVNHTSTSNWLLRATEEMYADYYNMGISGHGYVREGGWIPHMDDIPDTADPDLITIFGSFNDIYVEDSIVGSATDVYIDRADNSIAAHMNYTFDLIKSKFPEAKIVVILPTPWKGTIPQDTSTSVSAKALQYVTVLEEICETREIPVLDLYRHSGLKPWEPEDNSLYFYNADGCHPNDKGSEIIASLITPFLEKVLKN